MLLFQSAQKTSKRYEIIAKQEDLVLLEEKDMKPLFRGLHNRLQGLAHRRQKHTSLIKKTVWALYDGKTFEKLVEQITNLVDELEKLFPVEATCRRLVELEIEEIEDEQSLIALKDAAESTDEALSDVVVQRMEKITGMNYAKDVKTEDGAKVRIGNEYGDTVFIRGIAVTTQSTNIAGTVVAKGESKIHIGESIGGRGLLDDETF